MQPAQEETKEAANMVADQESSDEFFETRWKCWKCKRIYQMADMCSKCNSTLADYVGDMSDILFEVKVGKPKKFIELPSKETPGNDE